MTATANAPGLGGRQSSAPSSKPKASDVLAALDVGIDRVGVAISYRLMLLVVAVTMLLLPLIYLSLILAVAYVVYLHAVHSVAMFEYVRGRAVIAAGVLYAMPLVAGPIAIVIMVKPFFARPGKPPSPVSLDPGEQPLLFEYVRRLCAAVGAPVPRRIDVDCQVNASASFRRGLMSLFGHDLVLTIGLPLAAVMDLRQLTGVLAHELGHFAQGGGMRVTYLVRTINGWFAAVVYGRDSWDDRLDALASGESWVGITIIVLFTKLMVWFSRRVLWLLMWFGHAISCVMLRQMEYDADRYQARVAGLAGFEGAFEKLHELLLADGLAMRDARQAWSEGRLPDDVPALIRHHAARLPPDMAAAVKRDMESAETKFFDTHPAWAARVSSVAGEPAEGLIHFELPAAALFRGFGDVCRRATHAQYEQMVGPRLPQVKIVPTATLLQSGAKDDRAADALRRYLHGAGATMRPRWATADVLTPPADPAKVVAWLREAHAAMVGLAPRARELIRLHGEAETRLIRCHQARSLMQAGIPAPPDRLGLHAWSIDAVGQAQRDAEREVSVAAGQLEDFEDHARDRLQAALRWLASRQADKGANIADLRARVRQLVEVLEPIRIQVPRLLDLRKDVAVTHALLQHLAGRERDGTYVENLVVRLERHTKAMRAIRAAVRDTRYPFDHARGAVTLAEFALPELPPARDIGAIMHAAASLDENLMGVYGRVLSRLAQYAEGVERALGIAPAAEG